MRASTDLVADLVTGLGDAEAAGEIAISCIRQTLELYAGVRRRVESGYAPDLRRSVSCGLKAALEGCLAADARVSSAAIRAAIAHGDWSLSDAATTLGISKVRMELLIGGR